MKLWQPPGRAHPPSCSGLPEGTAGFQMMLFLLFFLNQSNTLQNISGCS